MTNHPLLTKLVWTPPFPERHQSSAHGVVRRARATTFQLAEVAVTGPMARAILAAIYGL